MAANSLNKGTSFRARAGLCCALALLLSACQNGEIQEPPPDCNESPGLLFERRVEPLFGQDHPNTCAECHAGGIDLESFLRKDACESMACLKSQGLVDLNAPSRSVLLKFILRSDPQSDLITKQTIAEEHQAFLSWIEHEATCGSCAEVACPDAESPSCETGDDLADAINPENDPGDCHPTTLERLFRGTVYYYRGRCNPCHFQEEPTATSEAPRWLSRTGSCQVASLASYQNAVESGYINDEDPLSSLLLLKPLAEADGGLPHGGHDKLQATESFYDSIRHFLRRHAECASEAP